MKQAAFWLGILMVSCFSVSWVITPLEPWGIPVALVSGVMIAWALRSLSVLARTERALETDGSGSQPAGAAAKAAHNGVYVALNGESFPYAVFHTRADAEAWIRTRPEPDHAFTIEHLPIHPNNTK